MCPGAPESEDIGEEIRLPRADGPCRTNTSVVRRAGNASITANRSTGSPSSD